MAQDLAALTNTWMLNPSMMDWTQASNQFSNYNNARIPFPPTYNTGAGGPVNAATGKPIRSFQEWQAANPGGLTISSTPAQPQQQAEPQQQWQSAGNQVANADRGSFGGWSPTGQMLPGQQQQAQAAPQAAPQASAPPNNWQQAINSLANPGRVATPGATVPQVTGYQPSGGVNAAFLQNAGAGQGMNQGFLSALRAIQGR